MYRHLFLLIVLLFSNSQLFAVNIPAAPYDALKYHANFNANNLNAVDYNFNAIVKLSNCSGSIIQFNGQPDTAKAIVLTNGHCIQNTGGFLKPGEIVFNRLGNRSMKVANKVKKFFDISATKLLYATMTGTDIALYELKETFNDLKKFQIVPLQLDNNHPSIKEDIEIISGFWERGYACSIDAFIPKLKEADWSWNDSIRYSAVGCETKGGTSGSPIISKSQGTVIGVNNTGNESGQRCTLNNPCEVDGNGQISVRLKASYGQQTFQVYSCLTPDFKIDLSISNCALHKGPTSNGSKPRNMWGKKSLDLAKK